MLRSLKDQTALTTTINKLPLHANRVTKDNFVDTSMPTTYQPLRSSLSPKQKEFSMNNNTIQMSKGLNFPIDNRDLPGYDLML